PRGRIRENRWSAGVCPAEIRDTGSRAPVAARRQGGHRSPRDRRGDRERVSTSPPRITPTSPAAMAAQDATIPLPVPGPPSAVAASTPPATRPISPATRAITALVTRLRALRRAAERTSADPPTTTPNSATNAVEEGPMRDRK